MIIYALLSLVAGVFIALSRAMGAKLIQFQNSATISIIHHLSGFIFISLIYIVYGFFNKENASTSTDSYIFYFGGVIGGVLVALNAIIFKKLGAAFSTLVVISSQIIFSFIMDVILGHRVFNFQSQFSIMIIVIGIYLLKKEEIQRF